MTSSLNPRHSVARRLLSRWETPVKLWRHILNPEIPESQPGDFFQLGDFCLSRFPSQPEAPALPRWGQSGKHTSQGLRPLLPLLPLHFLFVPRPPPAPPPPRSGPFFKPNPFPGPGSLHGHVILGLLGRSGTTGTSGSRRRPWAGATWSGGGSSCCWTCCACWSVRISGPGKGNSLPSARSHGPSCQCAFGMPTVVTGAPHFPVHALPALLGAWQDRGCLSTCGYYSRGVGPSKPATGSRLSTSGRRDSLGRGGTKTLQASDSWPRSSTVPSEGGDVQARTDKPASPVQAVGRSIPNPLGANKGQVFVRGPGRQ